MITDEGLLDAWRGGDAASGEALIERHLEAVHRFFSNKVRHASDDLVQKTFLACVETLEGYEGRAGFRSYLFGIARRILYRHYRDAGRHFDAATVTASALIDDASSPADRVEEREDRRLLLRALRALPLDLQILVELAYWEGLSDRELAEVVDVPTGTVKSRLRKARRLLDESLPVLASSPVVLESSRTTLDAWAAGIRDLTQIEGQGRRR